MKEKKGACGLTFVYTPKHTINSSGGLIPPLIPPIFLHERIFLDKLISEKNGQIRICEARWECHCSDTSFTGGEIPQRRQRIEEPVHDFLVELVVGTCAKISGFFIIISNCRQNQHPTDAPKLWERVTKPIVKRTMVACVLG